MGSLTDSIRSGLSRAADPFSLFFNIITCGDFFKNKYYLKSSHRLKAISGRLIIIVTVKAPNIAHLSLLTSVGYNKKEIKLKKCAQPNKVIIIYYLHRV